MLRSTTVGRLTRTVIVFLMGAALGTGVIAPVAAASQRPVTKIHAVTTYARYASCAGLDFFPNSSGQTYLSQSTERYGGGYFICNPNLPNGAQLRRVYWTVRDDSSTAQISACELVSSDLRPGHAGEFTTESYMFDTGIAATPGVVRVGSSFDTLTTVNNAAHGYWIQCASLETSSPSVGIYGVEVRYLITSTDG
jgi:hypothetical protein